MEVVIKAEVTLTRSQVLVSGVFTAVSQSAVVIDQLLSVTGRQSETKPSIKVSQCFCELFHRDESPPQCR